MIPLTKKQRAFTIAEMLVVLVISAIAISIAMLVLGLVQTQIRSMSRNYNRQTQIRLLEKALWQDFNTHDPFYNPAKRQLQCISEKDTITYTFHTEYLLRNTDTLKIPIFKTISYLEGTVTTVTGQIDALEIQLKKEQPNKIVFINTVKDGAFYINGI
ncbi:MAG TPA: type II secretion system protein [Flavobacteriia bacterium]|jgi:prepilin-type N-terminal cleavage/methylation domain-containing protein|nr:type II secretion system protein [Flavobacteriia bacterium]